MTGTTTDHLVSVTALVAALLVCMAIYSQTLSDAIAYQRNHQIAVKANDLIDSMCLSTGSPVDWGQSNCLPSAFGVQQSGTGGLSVSPFAPFRLMSSESTVTFEESVFNNISIRQGVLLFLPADGYVTYSDVSKLLGVNGSYGFQLTIMPTLRVFISEVTGSPLEFRVQVQGPGGPVSGASVNGSLYHASKVGPTPFISVLTSTAETNSIGSALLTFSMLDVAIANLEELKSEIEELPPDAFYEPEDATEIKEDLLEDIDEIVEDINERDYEEAVEELNDLKEEIQDEIKPPYKKALKEKIDLIIDIIIESILEASEAYSVLVQARLTGLVGVGFYSKSGDSEDLLIPLIVDYEQRKIALVHRGDVGGTPPFGALHCNFTMLLLFPTQDYGFRSLAIDNSTGKVEKGTPLFTQIPTFDPGILLLAYRKGDILRTVIMPWGISALGTSVMFGGDPSGRDWVATELRQVTVRQISYQVKLAVWREGG